MRSLAHGDANFPCSECCGRCGSKRLAPHTVTGKLCRWSHRARSAAMEQLAWRCFVAAQGDEKRRALISDEARRAGDRAQNNWLRRATSSARTHCGDLQKRCQNQISLAPRNRAKRCGPLYRRSGGGPDRVDQPSGWLWKVKSFVALLGKEDKSFALAARSAHACRAHAEDLGHVSGGW